MRIKSGQRYEREELVKMKFVKDDEFQDGDKEGFVHPRLEGWIIIWDPSTKIVVDVTNRAKALRSMLVTA